MAFADELVACLPAIRRYAYSLSRDDADDLIQDTALKALRQQKSWEPGTNLTAWAITICRNCFRDYRKINPNRARLTAEFGYLSPNIAPESVTDKITCSEVATELDRLSESSKTAILLAVVEGFSYEEVATRMGCPVNTVASHVMRGRNTIRERMIARQHVEDSSNATTDAFTR